MMCGNDVIEWNAAFKIEARSLEIIKLYIAHNRNREMLFFLMLFIIYHTFFIKFNSYENYFEFYTSV